jgi:protein-disulfide isomerase
MGTIWPSIRLDSAIEVAKKTGANMKQLQADLDDPTLDDVIRDNYALADTLSLTGTPAYIIGNQVIMGSVGLEKILAALDSESDVTSSVNN